MVISESKKFIFLHNPKCAGTSIRTVLNKFDTRANYYWGFSECNGHKIDKAHMPLNVFRKFAKDDFALLNSYFVFGFVRNPYARAVSAFNESHQVLYKDFKEKRIVLAEYQTQLNNFIHQLSADKVIGWTFRYRHFIRQSDIFWLENKLYADMVLKVEEIETNINKLNVFLPSIDLKLSETIKVRNQKPMDYSPSDILDEQSINIINHIYQNDFIVFDYPILSK